MKTDFELQSDISDKNFKQAMRQQSISIAEHMQPTSFASTQGLSLQNQDKSVTKLLQDAETIYNWLIKYL